MLSLGPTGNIIKSFWLLFLVLLSKGLINVLQPIHSVAWVTWEATVYKPLKKSMQGPWESTGGQNGPVPEHLRAASWEHQQWWLVFKWFPWQPVYDRFVERFFLRGLGGLSSSHSSSAIKCGRFCRFIKWLRSKRMREFRAVSIVDD